MRGKGLSELAHTKKARITPACAGKTRAGLPACRVREDHPRVCGENFPLFVLCVFPIGSPPRVRGKHRDPIKSSGRYRITPACAGKTVKLRDIGHAVEDHPRVCGENGESTSESDRLPGSPPRVRGKRGRTATVTPVDGITPACAGKTLCYTRKEPSAGDHPRVCGENFIIPSLCAMSLGSPPRVRGKPHRRTPTQNHRRITPACAGKTYKLALQSWIF